MLVKIGKNEVKNSDKALIRAVEDFCDLKLAIDELNEKLKPLRELIGEFAKEMLKSKNAATINFILDSDSGVKVSLGYDVKISDESNLRLILGERFDDLVKTTTLFKPEKKLQELALNDDGIKGCLDIREKTPYISLI
ncbi:hypothetical protein [Campylobacter corcagiensis]|uniref:Uncharacterized protein n=1 Tax=Campylobacter corcagiensis TaxID=1448857 RepID=A0A7M1LFQ0_9BACT|nr:hypothetical protein [Campylobacter corcagiensis]QKF64577.1 hypothetical protein CCORG_0716 [Campylobacter corcagiensis]QOQ87250.1 hypothetical protein IMC76_08590 [Campylobacter corcagiensis]